MATIRLDEDNIHARVWCMRWVEADANIGRIVQDRSGDCRIFPSGPYWSPMKSFAAFVYDSPQGALAEVMLYFRGR